MNRFQCLGNWLTLPQLLANMAQISHAVESPSHLRTKMGGLSKASDRMRNPVSKTPGRSRRSVGAQFLKSISWAQRYFHWKLLAFVDFQAGANNCQSISKTEICCWPDSTASGSKKWLLFKLFWKCQGIRGSLGGGKSENLGTLYHPMQGHLRAWPILHCFRQFQLGHETSFENMQKSIAQAINEWLPANEITNNNKFPADGEVPFAFPKGVKYGDDGIDDGQQWRTILKSRASEKRKWNFPQVQITLLAMSLERFPQKKQIKKRCIVCWLLGAQIIRWVSIADFVQRTK